MCFHLGSSCLFPVFEYNSAENSDLTNPCGDSLQLLIYIVLLLDTSNQQTWQKTQNIILKYVLVSALRNTEQVVIVCTVKDEALMTLTSIH